MRKPNRFTNLWNRAKSQKEQKSLLWYNLEIPAKLFYKIVDSNDMELLTIKGNPSEKELQKAWFSIIDAIYKVKKDGKQLNIQQKQVQIALLSHKINAITAILTVLYRIILTEKQQNELIKLLRKLQIKVNKVPFDKMKDEIHRVLMRDVAGLKTLLKIEQDRLKDMMQPMDKKVTFERVCMEISKVFNFYIGIDLTLGEFLAAEQSAIETSNNLKNNG